MGADVGDGRQLAALLHQDAPVVVGVVVEPVLGVAAVDVVDRAHVAAAHHVVRLQVERVEADVVADGRRLLFALRQLHQLGRLLRVHGQRLLAQDVLAGQERLLGQRVMQHVGHGEMDGVNVLVRQHFVDALVRAGQAELLLGRGRFLVIDAENAGHGDAEPAQRLDVDGADETGADYRGVDLMQHDVVSLGCRIMQMMNDER